jgi:hypothetical protein
MSTESAAKWLLAQEARALLTRLARVMPFALLTPMVTAAAVSPAAQTAIERYLADGRRALRTLVAGYLRWLYGPAERTQHWGLDLRPRCRRDRRPGITGVLRCPPVICYLARGHGAAIRRARTRLPGGGENPVAVVRVPRERMIGSGIASSLVHEVGHQGAALLDLVNSLRRVLPDIQQRGDGERFAWLFWERWISEIVADFWSIAKVGVASTLGLIGVVSLPRIFVFRNTLDDPHPIPWIRVKLSCAIGRALYPHPQWDRLADLWESCYFLVGVVK